MLHFANKAGGGGICPSPRTDAVVSYTTTLQKEHLCHIWTKFNHSLRSPQFCGQDRGKGQTDRQADSNIPARSTTLQQGMTMLY